MSEFENLSRRAIRVIFLVRKIAGQRGAASLEPEHLLEGLVREDQGEFAAIFPGELTTMTELRPTRSFFSGEAASKILAKLDSVLTDVAPVADSADMPVSPELGRVLNAAVTLSVELQQKRVEPMHLLAAVASNPSGASELLEQLGIQPEFVIAAIHSGEYV